MPSGRSPEQAVLCLTGFMGSGKSTIGTLLARQLAWRFEDLDSRIEERTNLGIPAIFERLGEPGFRQLEAEELLSVLGRAAESHEPLVLAMGGGTYAQPGVIERLRGACAVVVWLDCPLELLLARCATMTNRPLFRDEASVRELLNSRLPFYQQADYRVTAGDAPNRVVARILALPLFAPAGFARSSSGKVKP